LENVRNVAATNQDLHAKVTRDKLHNDFFYRWNVFSLSGPPLRERIEDLPMLVEELLGELACKLGRHEVPTVRLSAMEALSLYPWPGNVRELRNVLERALILCRRGHIRAADLGLPEIDQAEEETGLLAEVRVSGSYSLHMAIEETKRRLVTEALARCHGNIKYAAAVLGITRDSLKHHIKALGLRR